MPRLLKKILKWTAIVVAVLIAITIAAVFYFTHKYTKGVEAANQRLIVQGAPMTLEEILLPPVPDEENAAILFSEAQSYEDEHEAALYEFEERLDEISDYGELRWLNYDQAKISELRQLFSQPEIADYLQLLQSACDAEYYYLELRDKTPIQMVEYFIPSVGEMIAAARYLSYLAMLSADVGDTASSTEYIKQQYHLANLLHQFPLLVVELTSLATAGMALDATEELTTISELSKEDLEKLQDAVEIPSYSEEFIRTIDLERLGFAEAAWSMIKGQPDEWTDMSGSKLLGVFMGTPIGELFYQRERYYYLSIMAEFRELYMDSETIDFARYKDDEEAVMQSAFDAKAIIVSILMPTYSTTYEKIILSESQATITRTALSLLMYHNDHGVYPDSLEALVPDYIDEATLDPFTGKPLVYRQVDEGFQLYSFGPNQIDDGGYEDPDDPTGYDIAWQGRGAVLVESAPVR